MGKLIVIASFTNGSQDELDMAARNFVEIYSNLPGIERTGRYRRINGGLSIALAEFSKADGAELHVPDSGKSEVQCEISKGYEENFIKRGDVYGDPRDLPILYSVGFPVPDEHVSDLASWYDKEHTIILHGCSQWISTRRFIMDESSPSIFGRHLALHYLSDIQALRSPEREAARKTAWRDRLATMPWFTGVYTVFLQELPD
ncbi:hypothetical protein C8J36_11716 [Rhizobium sp. PP-F2F-G48]|uniref:hypothetical protein n=1 Tax=Rhizobium sp. PP-F2F-G48 TaxID=2135651 RepID=UPI00104F0B07|nr:hypothetical protein [Rhizobium sp. PP-F2F-G48]TCM46514.1 hypothetical protein C8J36_11716 [Rhizobium sp. PP-F2F-G48]